jgi:hypothetical protein
MRLRISTGRVSRVADEIDRFDMVDERKELYGSSSRSVH